MKYSYQIRKQNGWETISEFECPIALKKEIEQHDLMSIYDFRGIDENGNVIAETATPQERDRMRQKINESYRNESNG